MVLQSSGKISASEIMKEMNNGVASTAKTSMSQMYTLAAKPVGFPIKFSDLYGKFMGVSSQAIYNAFVFHNAGATGTNGPTAVNIANAYSGTPWASSAISMHSVLGVQKWVVYSTGTYSFVVAGAGGGNGSINGTDWCPTLALPSQNRHWGCRANGQ